MSFLTPLYLAGLAAVSLPILLHLFRNSVRKRIPFSVVRFVDAAPSRTTRRMQIEHWPLMLLRAAALTLLALAFARPFFRTLEETPADSSGRRIVILIDTSASLRRDNLWTQVRSHLEDCLRDLTDRDEVALATFSHRTEWLVPLQEWTSIPALDARKSLLLERFTSITPGWSDTQLGPALLASLDHCRPNRDTTDPHPAQTNLIVITDLQVGTQLEGLRDHDWPRDVSITLRTVETPKTTNASLQLVHDSTEPTHSETQRRRRVRVANSADATGSDFRLHWNDAKDAAVAVTVPPGQSRVVLAPAMPLPSTAESNAGLTPAPRLVLTGDDHDFDNTLLVVPERTEYRTVLYEGPDEGRTPDGLRYFLERAFPTTNHRSIQVINLRDATVGRASQPGRQEAVPGTAGPGSPAHKAQPAELQTLAIVTGEANPRIESLRRLAESGGTVLIVACEPADAKLFETLAGCEPLDATEAEVAGFSLLTDINFTHPAWKPFDDPQFADFSRIHIWKHRHIDVARLGDARILARFDDGDPALVEQSLGNGRVLLLTTSWRPADSQLALSAKFAPFLNALLDPTQTNSPRQAYVIDDTIPLDELVHAGGAVSVIDPNTQRHDLASAGSFQETTTPGVYVVTTASSSQPTDHPSENGAYPLGQFAVQVAPEESRTEPMPIDRLTALGVPITTIIDSNRMHQSAGNIDAPKEGSIPSSGTTIAAAQQERQQKTWRWLILAALAVVLFETAWAGRLAK